MFYTNISRKRFEDKDSITILQIYIIFKKISFLFILQGEWLSSFLSYTSTEENKNQEEKKTSQNIFFHLKLFFLPGTQQL